jgi:hypothetical protein
VWHDHGEVEPPVVGAESNRNEDDDRMFDMVADIGREYEVGSGEQGQPSEVQNFYMLLTAADDKVHDDTDVYRNFIVCPRMFLSRWLLWSSTIQLEKWSKMPSNTPGSSLLPTTIGTC